MFEERAWPRLYLPYEHPAVMLETVPRGNAECCQQTESLFAKNHEPFFNAIG
jgi:hypothetical protein